MIQSYKSGLLVLPVKDPIIVSRIHTTRTWVGFHARWLWKKARPGWLRPKTAYVSQLEHFKMWNLFRRTIGFSTVCVLKYRIRTVVKFVCCSWLWECQTFDTATHFIEKIFHASVDIHYRKLVCISSGTNTYNRIPRLRYLWDVNLRYCVFITFEIILGQLKFMEAGYSDNWIYILCVHLMLWCMERCLCFLMARCRPIWCVTASVLCVSGIIRIDLWFSIHNLLTASFC